MKMKDTIREVNYYSTEVADQPGAALPILAGLKKASVDLLAYCGFPIEKGKAQLDFVPKNDETFRTALAQLGVKTGDPKRAFLIQGGDRIGAVAEIVEMLSGKKINLTAAQAVCAGDGRWGMILWVKPTDFSRARQALGV